MIRNVGRSIVLAATLAACTDDDASVAPWDGTLASGVERMEALADEGRFDDALAVADRIVAPDALSRARAWLERATRGASESALSPLTSALDAVGVDALTDADRAEVEFARAIVLLRSTGEPASGDEGAEDAAGRVQRAVRALERARAAGGGARLDAVYDLATIDLERAEAVRATIPEIAGESAPPPPTDAGKDDEDPVDVARRAYLSARAGFVERLRLGGDADARANVELVLRRLRELDEIERQREEEKQQQQQQQGDEQQDRSDESSDESQESESSEESERDPQEDPSGDGSEEGEESEPEPETPEPDEGDESGEEEPEPSESEESDSEGEEEPSEEDAEPEREEALEKVLTEEEIKRFLERNREYQEDGEKLKRLLRMRRKIPTRRDW